MLTATLGGLIKDYRLRKRLSQFEVSLRIGWKDTTRLSKIEQGRVGKPTRKTIEKIIKALKLNEQERGEFLLVGGYLPTDAEIKKVIKEISPKVDSWPYPAYIMDFSWRGLYTNVLNLKLFKMDLSWKKQIENLKPNVLIFPFLPKEQIPVTVEKGEDKNKLKPFAIAQIAAFKTETHQFQNEGWYNKLIQELMKFEEFRKLWSKIDQKDYHKKLYDYEYKRIAGVYGSKKRSLEFHIFTAKLINDPRFQEVLYYPADKATEEFCLQLKEENIMIRENKLVSHIALFTDADVKTFRRFLLNYLLIKLNGRDKSYYFRYTMGKPGKKQDLKKLLGAVASKCSIRDWEDLQEVLNSGRFKDRHISLFHSRKELEDIGTLAQINHIEGISEVSGYTFNKDREGMLFWEKNMGKILSSVFPEEQLSFSYICVYPMYLMRNKTDIKLVEGLHDSIWFLSAENVLKVVGSDVEIP